MSAGHLSKEFFEIVKAIGESRSKQEEDKIILKEVAVLKQKFRESNVSSRKMKEYVIRMIYVEMLGHDASFGHIEAVKLVSTRNLMEKRVGYLGVSLTLHKDHEFMILLVSCLQADLKSDNFLETCMGLTVVCKLINIEMQPAVLPLVLDLLNHKQALVRKKAVMALHHFYQLDPDSLHQYEGKIRKVLCDKDPSVMGASLSLLYDIIQADPSSYKELVPSFVSILKQVTEHRLPRDFDYHRMPAPWIQIDLLRILGLLGTDDKRASEGMYEVLHEVMKRADIGINVGYAIVYECVRTVTQIYPDENLIEDAAMSISRFITADNHNLKYLGVNSLASIVTINPKYAAEHQLIVIDCLEDPDETLKRKTLDLLYRMTNPANIEVVAEKLVAFLENTNDVYLRTELVSRITSLAERYAPSMSWYLSTLNTVFELGSELMKPEIAHNLMKLIADSGADLTPDGEDMRVHAVRTYIDTLNNMAVIPDLLTKVIAWVLGEYGHLIGSDVSHIITKLCEVIEQHHEDTDTRSWVLQALMKLAAHVDVGPEVMKIKNIIEKFQNSNDVDLQQRSHEFLELSKSMSTMRAVLPRERFADELTIDAKLSFLDSYVQEALDAGAQPYNSQLAQNTSQDATSISAFLGLAKPNEPKLHFDAYSSPDKNTSLSPEVEAILSGKDPSTVSSNTTTSPAPNTNSFGLKLASNVEQKWGPTGYNSGNSTNNNNTNNNPDNNTNNNAAPPLPPFPTEPVAQPKPPPPPPRRDEPTANRVATPEPTEKELMAQSLFAGILPSSSTSSSHNRTSSTTSHTRSSSHAQSTLTPTPQSQHVQQPQQPTPQQPTPQPTPRADPIDLLFGGGAATSPTTNNTSPPANTGGATMDLLSDIFGGGSGSTNAATSGNVNNVNNNQGGGSGIDLLSSTFGGVDLTSANNNTSHNNNSVSSGLDIFGGSIAPAPSQPQVALGLAGVSPSMRQRLDPLPKSSSSDSALVDEKSIYLSAYKAYVPDRTMVVLFITNKSQQPQQARVVVGIPDASFSFSFDGEPKAVISEVKGGHCLTVNIAAGQTSTQIVALQCGDVRCLQTAALQGQLSTQVGAFNFKVDLNAIDFVRANNITTPQYGQLWPTYKAQIQFQVNGTSCGSAADVASRMQQRLGLCHVETIGSELIGSGKLTGTSNFSAVVLCHVKHMGNTLDVKVRSQSPQLSQAYAQAVAPILQ